MFFFYSESFVKFRKKINEIFVWEINCYLLLDDTQNNQVKFKNAWENVQNRKTSAVVKSRIAELGKLK